MQPVCILQSWTLKEVNLEGNACEMHRAYCQSVPHYNSLSCSSCSVFLLKAVDFYPAFASSFNLNLLNFSISAMSSMSHTVAQEAKEGKSERSLCCVLTIAQCLPSLVFLWDSLIILMRSYFLVHESMLQHWLHIIKQLGSFQNTVMSRNHWIRLGVKDS